MSTDYLFRVEWTDERIATLKKLYDDGYSASRIADRLGFTSRNAVIGKIHRLGLPKRGINSNTGAAYRVKCGRKPKRKLTPVEAKPVKVRVRAALPVEPLPKEDIPRGPLVMFADLENHHCRAPYGDPKLPGFGFCGCQVVPGMSYCVDHARRFYAAPQPRRPYTPGVPRQLLNANSAVSRYEREEALS